MILLSMCDLCSMQEFAVLVRWGAVRAEADVGKGRMSDRSQLSSPTTQPTTLHFTHKQPSHTHIPFNFRYDPQRGNI